LIVIGLLIISFSIRLFGSTDKKKELIRFLKKIFRNTYKVSKKSDLEYSLGKYKIILPNNHVLKTYQNAYPLYDRFLPILCADFDGLIIDIGANIGDSSIAIFSRNSKSFILGVEPDNMFYKECVNNVFRNGLKERFLGVNKFISTTKAKFSIEKSYTNSTGTISTENDESGEVNSISFSELLELIPLEKRKKIDIVKIDTDGFDWDIINSFLQNYHEVKIKSRFVFFEMQTYLNNYGVNHSNRKQIVKDYKSSIEGLKEIGYNNFLLLDNFGTPIKITKSIDEILEINDYILRSQIYNSHSAIYYIDIVTFGDVELEYVNMAISNLYKIIKT